MELTCPITTCRAANDLGAAVCVRCGAPLTGYARLVAYPALLFNLGLEAARAGQLPRARDLFAAVVHWCPMDLEARNALAMACLAVGDRSEARLHWETVLARSPSNPIAARGIGTLDDADVRRAESTRRTTTAPGPRTGQQKKTGHKRKKR